MKCPGAQNSSSQLRRPGGCCWIMKVFERLAQGGMASLCARTGDLLLKALSWLLSVPYGRDHWPSSIGFLWAGCSSLPRVTPKATKYAAWLLSDASDQFCLRGEGLESQAGEPGGMGQRHCKSWGAGQGLARGHSAQHRAIFSTAYVLSLDMPQGRSSVSPHVAAVLA